MYSRFSISPHLCFFLKKSALWLRKRFLENGLVISSPRKWQLTEVSFIHQVERTLELSIETFKTHSHSLNSALPLVMHTSFLDFCFTKRFVRKQYFLRKKTFVASLLFYLFGPTDPLALLSKKGFFGRRPPAGARRRPPPPAASINFSAQPPV